MVNPNQNIDLLAVLYLRILSRIFPFHIIHGISIQACSTGDTYFLIKNKCLFQIQRHQQDTQKR